MEGALAAEDALEVERWVAPARSACPAWPIGSASKISGRNQHASEGAGGASRGKLRRP